MPNLKFLLRQLSQFLQTDRYLCHKQTEDLRQQIQAELPRTWLKVLTAYWLPQRFWQYLVLRWRLKQLESKRQHHNLVFVQREVARQSEFFDHVAKFPLDQQQRLAVVADEDNNLVIAGAGSGKTMTIVAKVRYLVEILGVPAEQILPISFTHKSAAEMTNRIAVEGIKPQTFHKFGLSVVQQTEGRRPDIFNDADSNQTLRSFLKQAMTDETYLVKLNQFLVKYLKIPKSQFEFKTLGEYIQYLKDQNFTTYKVITYSRMKKSAQQRQTFKNETVKSIEICQIANFLLLNGIKYNYEKPYEAPADGVSPKVTYRPDFTIKTKSGMVYIDHLQLNRRGYVPSFLTRPHETPEIAKRRYQKTLLWKRRLHRQNKTTLIETTSYDFYDHQLFQKLEKNLRQAGVEFKPLSPLEQWELIKKSGRDQIDEFLGLVKTFLALLKSNGYTIQQSRCFNRQKSTNNFLKRRAALFIDLFEVIYQKYQAHLEQADQIDFNDMITKATDYIQSGRYYCPLQYVIIDEFQDLSFGRYRILEAIRAQNPAVKFYCVGDDWQSIFRFAGSDVTLFSQFERFLVVHQFHGLRRLIALTSR